MLKALNCGYDTDYTCATAGAILGDSWGRRDFCYLLQNVYALYSKQESLVIGASGEVKVWLNSQVLGDGRSKSCFWNLNVLVHHAPRERY